MSLLKIIRIIPGNVAAKSNASKIKGLKRYTEEDLIYTEDGIRVTYIRLKDGYKVPYEVDGILLRLLKLEARVMSMPDTYPYVEKEFDSIERLMQDYIEIIDSSDNNLLDDKKKVFVKGLSQIEQEMNRRLETFFENYERYHIYR